MFPNPRVEKFGDIFVVRDDLIKGGTKARIIGDFLGGSDEWVYASPAYGYAQVALACTCKRLGKNATIFVAKRKIMHPRTLEARAEGAKIVQVPHGYLSNVKSKAAAYCEYTGASLLPFGFDFPEFLGGISDVAGSIDFTPDEVWTVAGSGTLSRALQKAWPEAVFHAVRVGAQPNAGGATVYVASEKFEQDARIKPPFPSCSNYDAKAWSFIKQHAAPGALFWNVAA